MKTIEYPIKELVSFRMDENKIWWLDYDWSGYFSHFSRSFCECPDVTVEEISNLRSSHEYDFLICQFCEEDNDFVITPESYYVNSPQP